MRISRPVVIIVLCSLGVVGVTAVAGAPPPEQLCGVCGPSTANDAEITGATGQGTLDIYVDETGNSRWHTRVPVNESAAERYQANATALEAAVDDAWARSHAADGDVRAVESTLENQTVVVNYTVADVAKRGVGDTWLLVYFMTGTSTTRYEVVAERVTIHTPDGTAITNHISAAAVDGNTATWTDDVFDDQTYITYGDGGLLDTARGYATIGLEVGPTALVHGVAVGFVPGVMIGLLGVVIGRGTVGRAAYDATVGRLGFERPTVDAVTLNRLVVAVGTVGAVGLLVLGAVTTSRTFPLDAVVLSSLGFGYALLGTLTRRLGGRIETRGLVGLALLATIAAAGYTRLLAGVVLYPPLLFGFATALFLPIGYAFERGRRPIALLVAVGILPSAMLALGGPMRVNVLTGVLAILVFLPWFVAVALFGYPLALLGRQLATT
ncbi:hypothetical protein [Natrinema sp. SYSU A 869]|uniref:hypothetical protein n=1 Tax=Natrinema sp. SYSU A 869 TaxID=2871694 RepID=UPI001CA3E089|nr:hypothetical protein [Natrinema sp. SYSU A 869]